MKRTLSAIVVVGVVAAAMVAVITAPSAFAQPIQPITVYVNERVVNFDVPPTTVQGRVLVPLRGIFESLGATVDYNPETQQITATDGATNVQLTVGSRRALVNGAPDMLDVPAFTIGGRVMVPLRFVSESLGAEVQWIAASATILIDQSGVASSVPVTVPANHPAYVPRPTVRTRVGRLMAVSMGPNSSIVVWSGNGQDATVPVTDSTAIYRYNDQTNAGGSAALGALRRGDMVTVEISNQDFAQTITATYRVVPGGRITGVNHRTVTLASGQSYVVLADAQITLNGQSAGFDAIQPTRIAQFFVAQGTNQAYEVHVTTPAAASVPIPVGLSAPGINAPANGATVGSAFVVAGRARPGATVIVTAEPHLVGPMAQETTVADGNGAWTVSLNVQAPPLVSYSYVVTTVQIVGGFESDPSSVEVMVTQ